MYGIKYGHIYNQEEISEILFIPIFSWNQYNDAVVIINPVIDDYCVDEWDRAIMGRWQEVEYDSVSEEKKKLILKTLLEFQWRM